jgi:hypothetical protein
MLHCVRYSVGTPGVVGKAGQAAFIRVLGSVGFVGLARLFVSVESVGLVGIVASRVSKVSEANNNFRVGGVMGSAGLPITTVHSVAASSLPHILSYSNTVTYSKKIVI